MKAKKSCNPLETRKAEGVIQSEAEDQGIGRLLVLRPEHPALRCQRAGVEGHPNSQGERIHPLLSFLSQAGPQWVR